MNDISKDLNLKENKPEICKSPLHSEMKQKFELFGLASSIYALFFACCLYKNTAGITFPFFVAGTVYYFGTCMKQLGIQRKKGGLFYMLSLSLLGISVFLTADENINRITILGIVLLLVSFMLHYVYEDREWNFLKHTGAIFQSIFTSVFSIADPFIDFKVYLDKKDKGKRGLTKYVILGFAFAVPFVLFIIVLLASADAVFADFIFKFFIRINLVQIIGFIFTMIAAFFMSYCFLSTLLRKEIPEESDKKAKSEPLPVIIVTAFVSAVYLFFCGIQILYLFVGKFSLPEGYTYAQYARQGFFQLLFVCILNLVMVLVCLSYFRENRILKGILVVISVCTYIMIVSSALRMSLYIDSYGLTLLRMLVLWALAVIALLMAGVIVSIFKGGFPLFRYAMVIVTVFYIGLAYSHPDYWIAKYNVENFLFEAENGTEDFDYRHLSELSADAALILTDPAYFETLSEKEQMSSYYNKIQRQADMMGIRKFNVSKYIAQKSLAAILQE